MKIADFFPHMQQTPYGLRCVAPPISKWACKAKTERHVWPEDDLPNVCELESGRLKDHICSVDYYTDTVKRSGNRSNSIVKIAFMGCNNGIPVRKLLKEVLGQDYEKNIDDFLNDFFIWMLTEGRDKRVDRVLPYTTYLPATEWPIIPCLEEFFEVARVEIRDRSERGFPKMKDVFSTSLGTHFPNYAAIYGNASRALT